MKKIIAMLLCMALLLSSCSARTAPSSSAPQEPVKQEDQSTENLQDNGISSAPHPARTNIAANTAAKIFFFMLHLFVFFFYCISKNRLCPSILKK